MGLMSGLPQGEFVSEVFVLGMCHILLLLCRPLLTPGPDFELIDHSVVSDFLDLVL